MREKAGQPGHARRRAPSAVCAIAAVAALAVAGCSANAGTTGPAKPGVIHAVGAENEYADVLGQIGGRYVQVTSILDNPNTDPHTFEASPSIAQEISGASLVVQNGVGYDSWINRIEAASPNSNRKVIVVQHLLGLPDSTPNPHLWYAPATMPKVASAMAADLAALQPSHAAYFRARLAAFDRALAPLHAAIARFKAQFPGVTAATTEPVADYLLTAMGIHNLTPFRFQADIMNGTDPAPEDIALENSFFSQHRVKFFAYNQQVVSSLTTSVRLTAIKEGVPVVGVYETMPVPGFDFQSWMLAEVQAIRAAVTAKRSTERL